MPSMDMEALTKILMNTMEEVTSKMTNLIATDVPQSKTINVVEYEGRMRVSGMEKFNAPSFLSSINYYTNQADKDKHKAKGALVLFVDSENAGKFFKSLGFTVPEDEDDTSMMELNGQLANMISENFKKSLVNAGYAELLSSEPDSYRNSAMDGIEFSPDQKTKIECSFFYFKHRAIVVELTLAPIPQSR